MLQQILIIFISAVFIENYVLVRFLGICSFLGVSNKVGTAFGMGIAVTFVMAISSFITWLTYQFVLLPTHLEYLHTIVFMLVIASFVQLVEMVVQKMSPSLYKALGVYLPLITTNCAVLGVCLIIMERHDTFLNAVLYGTFSGLGFTLAIVIFAGIRERLNFSDVSPNLEGFPISLVSASLVSLAFLGFQGLIK
jgi:electron transport complex protein RnfA